LRSLGRYSQHVHGDDALEDVACLGEEMSALNSGERYQYSRYSRSRMRRISAVD